MATHTPGPWRRQGLTIVAENPFGDGSWEVASAIGWGGDFHEQSDANSDLIAAAPDLLSALRELEHRTREYLSGELVTFPSALLAQVRETIAAASCETVEA